MRSILLTLAALVAASGSEAQDKTSQRRTNVSIDGEMFLINGQPTYGGRVWQGKKIEGLLLNSRMVQATFDDLNPATRGRWAYPDTGEWEPERNLGEFLAMLPEYRRHGLQVPGRDLFYGAVHLHGGPAPVHRFLPEMIDLVLRGAIIPGKVFDLTLPLDRVAEGYRAMDERRAIKALLLP